MTRLDDRIREGLTEAGRVAAAPDVDALTDEVARRRHRRETVRRIQAGAVALGVIAVLAISFSYAMTRAGRDEVPSSPEPSVSVDPDRAVQIAGVPFPVCHPMTIPGSFGEGVDTLWVIEREPGPDEDCSLAEGFQYVGVGTASEVTNLSQEIHDIGQEDSTALWPFAVPDIDGDGIDEIAVGLDGTREKGYARIALYRIAADGGSIRYLTFDCGPACDPAPWIGLGTFVEGLSGAYCDPEGFVRWSASEGRVIGTAWSLEGDRLVRGQDVFDRVDDGTDYPPDGMSDLCGSPSTFPEDFSAYPDEPSQEPEPALVGGDIGIGTNVCGVERLGGLDILPGDDLEAAWTGYLVKDDGTCPDRNPDAQIWFVAIDAGGDGVADTWTTFPSGNCPYVGCWPLAASDLDGDGDGELIVTTGFSIQDQIYFAIETGEGGASIAPILVAPPGHPEAGITGGEPLITSSGGDEGHAAWIRCEGYPAAPVLVFTSVSSIVESEEPTDWHEVKLQLQADGMFHVVDHIDRSLPPGEDPGLIRSEAPACGVDFRL
jgi:hypothetical protein